MTKFVSIVLGFFSKVIVKLIGSFYFSEFLSIAFLPFIGVRNILSRNKELRFLIKLIILILFAQIISDVANNSDFIDYIRGWAVFVFSIISLIVYFAIWSKNDSSLIFFFIGLFLIKLVFGDVGEENPFESAAEDILFKTRIVPFMNPLVLILAYYFFKLKKFGLITLSLIGYGLFCIIMGARSNSLVFLVSGFLFLLKKKDVRISFWVVLFSGIIFYGLYVLYIKNILEGKVGSNIAYWQVTKMSNPYNPFELLYYGRADFAVLVEAVRDKPWFGHGSWGKDPNDKYAHFLSDVMKTDYVNYRGYIPAHSIFMGTWAYAGLLGAIFVFLLFYKVFNWSRLIYKNLFSTLFGPTILILGVEMLWNFFFSPIGHFRTTVPIFFALVIIEFKYLKEKNLII